MMIRGVSHHCTHLRVPEQAVVTPWERLRALVEPCVVWCSNLNISVLMFLVLHVGVMLVFNLFDV